MVDSTDLAASSAYTAALAVILAAADYPTREQLLELLGLYVDANAGDSSGDPAYLAECTDESVEWLTVQLERNAAHGTVPVKAYTRAFLEVGAQLWRRRRSWGNIDPLDAPATPPVRSNPYSAAYPILAPYIGPVMA